MVPTISWLWRVHDTSLDSFLYQFLSPTGCQDLNLAPIKFLYPVPPATLLGCPYYRCTTPWVSFVDMDTSTQDSRSDKDRKNNVDHIEKTAPENIDTTHTDEAMKVLAGYTGDESWEPSDEKRLVRKVDWRLLPLLCMTYGLQYYDKAMLSQAVRNPNLCFNRC